MVEAIVDAYYLFKKYGGKIALNNLSFKVFAGEIYSVLGPNGAGKTTLLKAIAGALRLDKGKITVLGHDSIRERIVVRRLIGVVAELPSLYPELSVWSNLYFIGRIRGVDKKGLTRRIYELAEEFGIKDLLKYLYRDLSKGLKRRVDIVAALLHDPLVLLLDEPTTGLDVIVADKLRELIVKLKTMGKTIILSSHYIDEAIQISDRVLLLHRGVKVFEGEPLKLRRAIGIAKKVKFKLDRVLNDELYESVIRELSWSGLDVNPSVDKSYIEVFSDNPLQTIDLVREALRSYGIGIVDVEIIPPSWRDVFKSYIEEFKEPCKGCPLAMGGCIG